jgi:hypothetical protein
MWLPPLASLGSVARPSPPAATSKSPTRGRVKIPQGLGRTGLVLLGSRSVDKAAGGGLLESVATALELH